MFDLKRLFEFFLKKWQTHSLWRLWMDSTDLVIERLTELWNRERTAMILFQEKCSLPDSFITNEIQVEDTYISLNVPIVKSISPKQKIKAKLTSPGLETGTLLKKPFHLDLIGTFPCLFLQTSPPGFSVYPLFSDLMSPSLLTGDVIQPTSLSLQHLTVSSFVTIFQSKHFQMNH